MIQCKKCKGYWEDFQMADTRVEHAECISCFRESVNL